MDSDAECFICVFTAVEIKRFLITVISMIGDVLTFWGQRRDVFSGIVLRDVSEPVLRGVRPGVEEARDE